MAAIGRNCTIHTRRHELTLHRALRAEDHLVTVSRRNEVLRRDRKKNQELTADERRAFRSAVIHRYGRLTFQQMRKIARDLCPCGIRSIHAMSKQVQQVFGVNLSLKAKLLLR